MTSAAVIEAVGGAIIYAEWRRRIVTRAAQDCSLLLHPEMARIYRAKVTELGRALQEPDSRSEATEAPRCLVDAIVLTPDRGGETLQIELKGNLAAMLGAAQNAKRSPETDDLSLQVEMVAGACNRRYLRLWSGVA